VRERVELLLVDALISTGDTARVDGPRRGQPPSTNQDALSLLAADLTGSQIPGASRRLARGGAGDDHDRVDADARIGLALNGPTSAQKVTRRFRSQRQRDWRGLPMAKHARCARIENFEL
jgi:hypothetical protein